MKDFAVAKYVGRRVLAMVLGTTIGARDAHTHWDPLYDMVGFAGGDVPSDEEIVMHCFVTFLDNAMSGKLIHTYTPLQPTIAC